MELTGKCPECGRAVKVPLMKAATIVVKRKCRCGVRWNVKAAPVPVKKPGVHAVHLLDFVRI